jgi:hypothetical protein
MKDIKEGNVYNVETSKPAINRSSELKDVNRVMMDQFWQAMARQNVTPEKAKEIVKTTFANKSYDS